MLVAVVGAHGGAGASTVAACLARAAGADGVLLDLDLAGGCLARRLGVEHDPLDAGLAGPDAAAQVVARSARPWAGGLLVPAATRPDLAWLVPDGAVAAACAAALRIGRTVVVDAARGSGPALEAVVGADRVVLVARATDDGLAAALALLGTLDAIGIAGPRLRLCLNGAPRLRTRAAAAVASRVLRRPLAAVVPHVGGDVAARGPVLRAAAALLAPEAAP